MKSLANEFEKVNPENKEEFIDYCKSLGFSGITEQCIQKAKQNKKKRNRKKSTFADKSYKQKKK